MSKPDTEAIDHCCHLPAPLLRFIGIAAMAKPQSYPIEEGRMAGLWLIKQADHRLMPALARHVSSGLATIVF